MRKCKFLDYTQINQSEHDYLETEEIYIFHLFNKDTAIVEDENGRVHTLPANQIKFIDQPRIKVDINKQ